MLWITYANCKVVFHFTDSLVHDYLSRIYLFFFFLQYENAIYCHILSHSTTSLGIRPHSEAYCALCQSELINLSCLATFDKLCSVLNILFLRLCLYKK